ncbi:hypothetical protein SF12_11635 [Streptomyces sp. MBRL 601]|nr:hypothetical protein SF12_11635 [Streptomyces sp. MBRL 601]
MVCCCGTDGPSRSHDIAVRASVSILSSRAGPHVAFSAASRFAVWTSRDMATHSFHTHRQRAHSAIRPVQAVDDTRSR